jgi:hypothetical protein
MSPPREADPFTALGLPAQPGLGDDDVRAAWRRVAAATHPDRADGGDPARFAAAAAAYTTLRTRSGRSETLADLARPVGRARQGQGRRAGGPGRLLARTGLARLLARTGPARLLARARRGRPLLLALRLAVVAAVSATAIAVAGWAPATPAVIAGALTWLVLTARRDLAPPS